MSASRPAKFVPSALATTAFALLLATAALAHGRAPAKTGPTERGFTFFCTAETHGTLEPCGCTSDPLGDVARYASVIRTARQQSGDVLLVDAGGLSFPEGG